MGRKDNSFVVYKVKQNLGKQVLRIPCPKFRSPSSEQLTMDRWGSCADLLKIGGCWGAVVKKIELNVLDTQNLLTARFCLTL